MTRKQRIVAGAIVGGSMGLIYQLVATLFNVILLVDIPLYFPKPGPVINIFIYIAGGAILGIITAIPEESIYGIGLGGAIGALAMSITGLVNNFSFSVTLFILYTFFSQIILFCPLAVLIRWVMKKIPPEVDGMKLTTRERFVPLFITLIIAGVVGGFSVYGKESRQAMRVVNSYVIAAIQTPPGTELPAPFKTVSGFETEAAGRYMLEPTDNLEYYFGKRPVSFSEDELRVVLIHFENGFEVVCINLINTITTNCERFVPFEARPYVNPDM